MSEVLRDRSPNYLLALGKGVATYSAEPRGLRCHDPSARSSWLVHLTPIGALRARTGSRASRWPSSNSLLSCPLSAARRSGACQRHRPGLANLETVARDQANRRERHRSRLLLRQVRISGRSNQSSHLVDGRHLAFQIANCVRHILIGRHNIHRRRYDARVPSLSLDNADVVRFLE